MINILQTLIQCVVMAVFVSQNKEASALEAKDVAMQSCLATQESGTAMEQDCNVVGQQAYDLANQYGLAGTICFGIFQVAVASYFYFEARQFREKGVQEDDDETNEGGDAYVRMKA